jgi:hypothetical protein
MRKALIAALAAALLTTPAASAHDNDQVVAGCGLDSVTGPLSGGEPTAVLYGYAVTPEAGGGEFRCYVRIDGTEVSSIAPDHSERVFFTAGEVFWWAADDQVVDICAELTWDDGHPPYVRCDAVTRTQIPPQVVVDLLDGLLEELDDLVWEPTDPVTCAVLRSLAPGVPGVVDVDPATGDVLLLGELLWDCPPYLT